MTRLACLSLVFTLLPDLANADHEPGQAHALFGRKSPAFRPLSASEQVERREGFQAMLEERGWVEEGDIVAPPWYFDNEPDPGTSRAGAWETPPHRATIFLNFFGGTMTGGTNSAKMQSACIQGTVEYPAYSGGEAKALAIIQVFESKMAPYGVRVAYEQAPPPELPYQMVMMGGTPDVIGIQGGALGVSCSSDCGDNWWRDTTFAFTEVSNQTATLAQTALQEAAHAFGLAHIDGSQHIMYPFAGSGDKIWADGCTVYNDATGGINCMPTHDIFCGGGSQDDHAELLAYFGPDSPDVDPPQVAILEPADGQEYPSGAKVIISSEVTDNHLGAGWKLVVEDEAGNELVSDPAFLFEDSWALNFPDGVYRVRVEAVDHDRNVGSDEVTVYVGEQAPETSTSGTTGGTDTGTGSESGTDSGTGTTPPMDGDETCACRVDRTLPPAFSALLLLGLAVRRRR